ncbi:unnamed protein product [Cuscuta epithymum]|uniref:Uncharacterized protein n=1 Tax=Cuscuta epithymum TaxID=186058 RepID=A0AAV0D6T2_9ASTE|nr:unnamed protein product [Cuscuta epithymum]
MERTLTFNPSYKHLLANSYHAALQSVDFRYQEKVVMRRMKYNKIMKDACHAKSSGYLMSC